MLAQKVVVLLTLSLVTTAVGGEPENKAEKYFNLTMTNVTTTDLQTYHDIALQLHKMEDEIQCLNKEITNRHKEAIEEGSQRLGDSKISNVFQDTVILDMNITAVYASYTTTTQYVPTGRIEFLPNDPPGTIRGITTPQCYEEQSPGVHVEKCLVKKVYMNRNYHVFRSPHLASYYFVFTASIKSIIGGDERNRYTKVSAWIEPLIVTEPPAYIIAEFIEYGTQVFGSSNAGRSFITMTFNVVLQEGDIIWFVNGMQDTLIYGPEQYPMELMVYSGISV